MEKRFILMYSDSEQTNFPVRFHTEKELHDKVKELHKTVEGFTLHFSGRIDEEFTYRPVQIVTELEHVKMR
jgi:hypothetical protein